MRTQLALLLVLTASSNGLAGDQHVERAEWNRYVANIFAAESAIQDNDVALAKRRLEQASEHFRSWEWGYLYRQAAEDFAALPAVPRRRASNFVRSVAVSPDGAHVAAAPDLGGAVILDLRTGHEVIRLKYTGSTGTNHVAYSPDGMRVAVASDDGKVNIFDAQTGEEVAVVRDRFGSPIAAIGFSPDCSRFMLRTGKGIAKIWDASSGELLDSIGGAQAGFSVLAISPDGKHFISSPKGTHVRDVGTGRAMHSLSDPVPEISVAAFSMDGVYIATGSTRGEVKLWSARTGKELRTFDSHSGQVSVITFSRDGSRLASKAAESIRIWDVHSGSMLFDLEGEEADDRLMFSPDRRYLASTRSYFRPRGGPQIRGLQLWDTGSGRKLATRKIYFGEFAFCTDGLCIVSGGPEVRVWDLPSIEGYTPSFAWSHPVRSIAFSPDETRILISGGPVKSWDALTGELLAKVFVPRSRRLIVSPDCSTIVAIEYEQVTLLDLQTMEELGTLHVAVEADMVAFSPDGKCVALVSKASNVVLQDVQTGTELLNLGTPRHERGVLAFTFSPDGRRGATAWWDKTVVISNVETGKEALILRGHAAHGPSSVAFSPDGTRVASAAELEGVILWDAASAMVVATRHVKRPCFAFSPSGEFLAIGTEDGTTVVLSSKTGEEISTLDRHESNVTAIAFNPDSRRIVTGSTDGTLKIWDVRTGDELSTLRWHKSGVSSVAFSADGTRIVSGSTQGEVKLWDSILIERRVFERQIARLAEGRVKPLVSEYLASGLQPTTVAEQLRTDESLSDDERRAGLNMLLRGAWQLFRAKRLGVGLIAHGVALTENAARATSTLAKNKQYTEAEAKFLDAHRILSSAPGPLDDQIADTISGLVALYNAWGKPNKADEWSAKLPQDASKQSRE